MASKTERSPFLWPEPATKHGPNGLPLGHQEPPRLAFGALVSSLGLSSKASRGGVQVRSQPKVVPPPRARAGPEQALLQPQLGMESRMGPSQAPKVIWSVASRLEPHRSAGFISIALEPFMRPGARGACIWFWRLRQVQRVGRESTARHAEPSEAKRRLASDPMTA